MLVEAIEEDGTTTRKHSPVMEMVHHAFKMDTAMATRNHIMPTKRIKCYVMDALLSVLVLHILKFTSTLH